MMFGGVAATCNIALATYREGGITTHTTTAAAAEIARARGPARSQRRRSAWSSENAFGAIVRIAGRAERGATRPLDWAEGGDGGAARRGFTTSGSLSYGLGPFAAMGVVTRSD